jgi:hypothetical protein
MQDLTRSRDVPCRTQLGEPLERRLPGAALRAIAASAGLLQVPGTVVVSAAGILSSRARELSSNLVRVSRRRWGPAGADKKDVLLLADYTIDGEPASVR